MIEDLSRMKKVTNTVDTFELPIRSLNGLPTKEIPHLTMIDHKVS